MSYDTRTDENGNLEIIVSRWYPKNGNPRVIAVAASGFEPYEPVHYEICGKDESEVPKEYDTVYRDTYYGMPENHTPCH